jgi:hypothetical protein
MKYLLFLLLFLSCNTPKKHDIIIKQYVFTVNTKDSVNNIDYLSVYYNEKDSLYYYILTSDSNISKECLWFNTKINPSIDTQRCKEIKIDSTILLNSINVYE